MKFPSHSDNSPKKLSRYQFKRCIFLIHKKKALFKPLLYKMKYIRYISTHFYSNICFKKVRHRAILWLLGNVCTQYSDQNMRIFLNASFEKLNLELRREKRKLLLNLHLYQKSISIAYYSF